MNVMLANEFTGVDNVYELILRLGVLALIAFGLWLLLRGES